jgi:Tfp pilus assembly protein PilV
MAATFIRNKRNSSQAGVSMIELLIAGVVLVVGCLALMGLILTGIATNNRNKMDTTGTLLAQSVFEQLDNVPANSTTTRTLTDCAGNSWNIAAAPGGATLLSNGNVDFSAATVANYNMQWVVCIGTVRATYDVRWNVQQLTTGGGTSLVTVGARKAGASNQLAHYALPVNMRRIFGQ